MVVRILSGLRIWDFPCGLLENHLCLWEAGGCIISSSAPAATLAQASPLPAVGSALSLCFQGQVMQLRLLTEWKCYQKALVTGKNNASEVNEVMGTAVPDPSPSRGCCRSASEPACLSLRICGPAPLRPWAPVGLQYFTPSVARKKDSWARYLSCRSKAP